MGIAIVVQLDAAIVLMESVLFAMMGFICQVLIVYRVLEIVSSATRIIIAKFVLMDIYLVTLELVIAAHLPVLHVLIMLVLRVYQATHQ